MCPVKYDIEIPERHRDRDLQTTRIKFTLTVTDNLPARHVKMAFVWFLVLFFCIGLSGSVPFKFVDRDEQQFIDHLLLDPHSSEVEKHSPHNIGKELDEVEQEKFLLAKRQAHLSQNSKQFHMIKKAAAAVVKRLSMPSPPKTDSLIEQAVHLVFKKSSPVEYAKIRSAIKEQVEKMILSNENKGQVPKSKASGLREEKILEVLEEILSELAAQLNLTTLQVKFLVNKTVNILSKSFGLKPWQNHELHERVTSHVRAKLKYEDWDNKDGRLRRLEENIEKEINFLKLTDKQARRLEAFMVQEEAAEEGLSKEERLRMLKRVIADIKDDFKTEKLEQESGPPKLSSVNIININNLIRQKALEMQLTKKELKVLGVAILTAIGDLTLHTNPTQTSSTQKPHSTKVTPTDDNDLEEELEGTKPPEHGASPTQKRTTQKHTNQVKTHSTKKAVASTRTSTTESTELTGTTELPTEREKTRETEDNLVEMLAKDEADLEEEEFRPKDKEEKAQPKDELELELEEKPHHDKISSKAPHVTEAITSSTEKIRTKTERTTYEPTEPTRTSEPNTPEKVVTHSRHTTEHTGKEIDEELLEGSTKKPTDYHTSEVTEHVMKTSPVVTHSVPTTKDKKLEEDLLEERVTESTESPISTLKVTQPTTEKLMKSTPKSVKTEQEKKPITKKTHPAPSTKNVNEKLEEDLLEDRVTNSSPKTSVTHSSTEYVGKSTRDPGEESNEIPRKKIHSRRHRVKVMENEAELEDMGLKKGKREDKSLEDDLLLEKPATKNKSLEDELADALSQKEATHDLENELKDLGEE